VVIFYFYPNVTTLRSGVCCRKSVCLSVVCDVRAPYSACWNLRQSFCTIFVPQQPSFAAELGTKFYGNHPVPVGS